MYLRQTNCPPAWHRLPVTLVVVVPNDCVNYSVFVHHPDISAISHVDFILGRYSNTYKIGVFKNDKVFNVKCF